MHAEPIVFPNRPIRLIVPGPPAGATDFLGRLLASELSKSLNQSVIVENKAGAAGLIGARFVKESKPDGYTLMVGIAATHAIGPYLRAQLPYDPINDFTPISLVALSGSFLIVSADSPIQSLHQLIQRARSEPTQLTYGTPGVGQTQHIIGLRLSQQAHIDLLHVPYVGTSPSITDLLGGRVSMVIASAGGVVPLIQAKKVRVMAVSSPKRSKLLPDVATFDEQGLPSVGLESFFAVFGPAGMDLAVRNKLSNAIAKVLADPDVANMVTKAYAEPVGSNASELREFLGEQIATYRKIINDAHLRSSE